MISSSTQCLSDANRILRMADLKQFVSISESHLYALISKGLFPKPIALIPGGRAKGWRQVDVEAWIDSRRSQSALG